MNPFNESTVIEYQIAENAASAQIFVYDMNGKQLKKIEISKQERLITINSREFTPGIYIYALLVDGAEVSTKRMMITD